MTDKPRLEVAAPVPEKVVVEHELGNPELYAQMQLAQQIGFMSKDLLEAFVADQKDLARRQFLRFLQKEEITVYPLTQVAAYLDEVVKKTKRESGSGKLVWLWKPLRQIDMQIMQALGISYTSWSEQNGAILGTPYNRAIPAESIGLIQRIAAAYPQVSFLVNDYEVQRPDPFLAVVGPGIPVTVIDYWDEPEFRKSRAATPPKS